VDVPHSVPKDVGLACLEPLLRVGPVEAVRCLPTEGKELRTAALVPLEAVRSYCSRARGQAARDYLWHEDLDL
jgi:hypothetical protein